MKLLVCDDVESRAKQTRNQIRRASGHDAELLSAAALTGAIQVIITRAQAALAQANPGGSNHGTSCFDGGFDVVVLDNNLAHLGLAGARHTAESIAGYVRAFVDIPYIVSLNKNPHVDFDLRYLIGDYHTQADLALNGSHLANRALWTGNAGDAKHGFLPWYWCALEAAADRRREQTAFVYHHFDDPILKALGCPTSAVHGLSRHAKGALSPEAANVSKVTFKTFFEKTCRSLPIRREREALAQAALRDKDVRSVVARVVAAELDRWIRRDLLGPQDVLVDVPHLLMRMPFLLGENAKDIGRWNEAVSAREPPFGLDPGLYQAHVAKAGFAAPAWTKSPCFWWGPLRSSRELGEMFSDEGSHWAECLFCEDVSLFRPAGPATRDEPMEFAAEFEGTWNRRHVAYLKGNHYRPQSRLAT